MNALTEVHELLSLHAGCIWSGSCLIWNSLPMVQFNLKLCSAHYFIIFSLEQKKTFWNNSPFKWWVAQDTSYHFSMSKVFGYVAKGLEGLNVMHFIWVSEVKKKKSRGIMPKNNACSCFVNRSGSSLCFLHPRSHIMALSVCPRFVFVRKINENRPLIFAFQVSLPRVIFHSSLSFSRLFSACTKGLFPILRNWDA